MAERSANFALKSAHDMAYFLPKSALREKSQLNYQKFLRIFSYNVISPKIELS
jgi:hypothetical protein